MPHLQGSHLCPILQKQFISMDQNKKTPEDSPKSISNEIISKKRKSIQTVIKEQLHICQYSIDENATFAYVGPLISTQYIKKAYG